MVKKYTNETLEFSDKLFIDDKESLEYIRLVKGLLKAAKDDIKEGKSSKKDSTTHLEEFIDELFQEYQGKLRERDKAPARLEAAQKALVKEDLKKTYSEFKNHLSEYAIWGVDNTKSETIIKSIKNCIAIIVEPIASIINVFGRLAGRDTDLIPTPNLDHSIGQSIDLKSAGNPKQEGRREPINSTFVQNVVKSRAKANSIKAK